MQTKLKAIISAAACLALTASMYPNALAAQEYIYRFAPEYTVDFEDEIYNGEAFPFETSLGLYNYADITVTDDAVKEYITIAQDEDNGNVLKVMPHEVDGVNHFKTSANLKHVFNTDAIKIMLDMYIPTPEDDSFNMFIQAYSDKTGIIFKADAQSVYDTSGTNKLFDLGEITDKWITWETVYVPAEDKSGAYVSTAYYIDGTRTVAETDTFYNNAFARYLAGGGFQELRFYCNNTAGEILLDNIEINGIMESDEPTLKNTADLIASTDSGFTKTYAKDFAGRADLSAKLTAEADEGAKYVYQTRKAFTSTSFLGDCTELEQDYYFPTDANVTLFTQIFSVAKGETQYGNAGVNRFLIPFEIKDGNINAYSAYTADANFDTSAFKSVAVPQDKWFKLRTKLYREDDKMYFSVEMEEDNVITELLPKTEVTWNADDYLKNGIFTFRSTISQEDTSAASTLYIGNAYLRKSGSVEGSFEGSVSGWRDGNDQPVSSLADGMVIPEIIAVSHADDKTVNIFTSSYTSDGRLIDVNSSEKSLAADVPAVLTPDSAIAVQSDTAYVKAFIWDPNMRALSLFGELTRK